MPDPVPNTMLRAPGIWSQWPRGEQILKSTRGMWEIMKFEITKICMKWEGPLVSGMNSRARGLDAVLSVTHGALAGRNFPSVPHSMEESASPILHVAFALSIGQTLLLPMLELSWASSFSALLFMYSITGSPIYFKGEKVEERLQVSYLFTLTLCLNG